jgi:Lon protease-like protein
MPMFPLNNGLVPYALVPLRVFEPRYLEMMSTLEEGDTFGIVLISRGSEVGGDDQRSSIGTAATIIARQEGDAGDLYVIAQGTSRIRVEEWLADDPFPSAMVVELADDPLDDTAVADELRANARRAAGLASELGVDMGSRPIEFSADPVIATYQAMSVVPLSAFDRQKLLELDSSARRLAAAAAAVAGFIEIAEFQLGGP